jgi:hypothetical protein
MLTPAYLTPLPPGGGEDVPVEPADVDDTVTGGVVDAEVVAGVVTGAEPGVH